jgi:hypothetical protein
MTQQYSVAGIAIERAPRFIGNGDFAERCTYIELHFAIGRQGVELAMTRMLSGVA